MVSDIKQIIGKYSKEGIAEETISSSVEKVLDKVIDKLIKKNFSKIFETT